MGGNSKQTQNVSLCDLTSGIEDENSNLLTPLNTDCYETDEPFYMQGEISDITWRTDWLYMWTITCLF